MCWSATADLVAGTAIASVGAVCVARTRRAGDLPLAALPLLLGAHQLVEAQIWHTGGGTGAATVAWAVIALPVLAVWVPVGVWCAVPRRTGRRVTAVVAVGVVTAAFLTHALATRPVRAEIRGHTMAYVIGLPHAELLVAGYLIATVGALLLSGDRRLTTLGTLTGAGALMCWLLWRLEFVSTWCALAAVCSVVLYGWARTRPAPRPVLPAWDARH
ncbi:MULTISPECIES: DUF6629 family protein [Streptomyces]|uniref:DUF6629 family protein n=1 Tax=Streptomyces doebereineriae TaxID=3075528 RepID=A0ABU2VKD4_9ACTN|nr:DUF6629 family protein [Streptomyces sp. DSM 41640]MDT0486050.1 DUF6629 family protein [Streptomyces sp. DSM 41640]